MYAVEVHNVSKTYRIYERPADRLKEALLRRPYHRSFEPLKNVSFVVPRGGILGIIGNNGAGKSTLLKILAGTLTPTTGQVIHRGRVAALLELGAGFHPEFSGRQNIYLNATLLGLSEEQVREKEQDIIDFSEIHDFIDQPVKTYSSGMYVRLAFSIATSVEPEILIIDEALSVGDMHFQKKCINRMMRFKEQGKTMLFCTHSMYQIQELCEQAIWLEGGRIRRYDSANDVVNEYMAHLEDKQAAPQPATPAAQPPGTAGLPEVLIEKIDVLDMQGEPLDAWEQFKPLRVRITTRRTARTPYSAHLAVGIIKPDEQIVFATSTKHDGIAPIVFEGRQTTEFLIPSMLLNSGVYQMKAVLGDEHLLHFFHESVTSRTFTVKSANPVLGTLWMAHEWRMPVPMS